MARYINPRVASDSGSPTHSNITPGATLIVDAGSTKTHWAVALGSTVEEFFSPGINPSLSAPHAVAAQIAAALQGRDLTAVSRAHWYGAGCRDAEQFASIKAALKPHLAPGTDVEVASDAVGAAVALVGNGTGVAAILGTGANAMLVVDGKVVDTIPPMGFILGDEGSGAWIGRQLVNAVFKRQLPPDILADFHTRYPFTLTEIIDAVYRSIGPDGHTLTPSRFLAAFAPFVKEHLHRPEIAAIPARGFRLFLHRNVLPMLAAPSLRAPQEVEISFIGSIACEFSDLLNQAVAEAGLRPGRIERSPMPSLIRHHTHTPASTSPSKR